MDRDDVSDDVSDDVLDDVDESPEHVLFPILINVLIYGAKRLYGEAIKPESITSDQYATLNQYMMSMGFVIQYDYTYDEDGNPTAINIWFNQY